MMSTTQCTTNAAKCQHLGMVFDISIQRANALLAMSQSWTTLASQKERYDAIRKEEGPYAASYGRRTASSVDPEVIEKAAPPSAHSKV
jgi:hypothetical protein